MWKIWSSCMVEWGLLHQNDVMMATQIVRSNNFGMKQQVQVQVQVQFIFLRIEQQIYTKR